MFSKIVNHLRRFRAAYLVAVATLFIMGGIASYQPDASFYGGSPEWLKASALQAPAKPVYTRGQFVIDIEKRLKKSKCFEDLCADMKGGMPEEKARCNLEKRGVYDKPAGYKWFEGSPNRSEAIKTLVLAFDALAENAQEPFKDVKADSWFGPSVASAYQTKWIRDTRDHLFKPNDLATKTWATGILRKTNLKKLCEVEG